MSVVRSESHLLRCFRAIDRAEVETPKVAFPIEVNDVFTWSDGPRSFLLFCAKPDDEPRGIVFHRSTGATPDVAAMCEWCHAVRAYGGVKLLSVSTDERHRIGLYLCSGLACMERARQTPGPDDIVDGATTEQRASRTLARIARFVSGRLGIGSI